MNQIRHLRLDKIKIPEFDSRLTGSALEDDELRDSIKELGILEPLLVKEVTDGFEIIFGNRRFHEAGRAGLAAVPCIVTKVTGAQSEKMKIHENLHRLPLSHVDQSYTFAHCIKEFNMTELQVATLVGKSIAYVSQHLSLLQSDSTLVQAVHDGRINFSNARELIRCKDEDEMKRLSRVVEENGATSQVIHGWVEESNRETDLVAGIITEEKNFDRPGDRQEPLYPCAGCGQPIPIPKIRIVRLCPECHYLIFSEIEREKQKARQEIHQNTPQNAP